MRVLGRSSDGERVIGRCGGETLSAARAAFAKTPRVDETVILSCMTGRNVARWSEPDVP